MLLPAGARRGRDPPGGGPRGARGADRRGARRPRLQAPGARRAATTWSTPRGRAQIAEAVAATITKVPSPVERDQLLRELAERLGGVGTEQPLRQVAASILAGAAPYRSRRTEQGAKPAVRRDDRPAEAARGRGVPPGGLPPLPRPARTPSGAPWAPRISRPPCCAASITPPSPCRRPATASDHRALVVRLAADDEAQAVLAGLPEDPTLEERIPFQIEFLERKRGKKRQVLEIRRQLEWRPGRRADARRPGRSCWRDPSR